MKLLLFYQMTAKLSLFIPYFQVAYQTERLLKNKISDTMFRLKSDEMTAL